MTAGRPSFSGRRLTVSFLLFMGLVWALLLVMAWFNTEHELNELLDAHLAQTAAVLTARACDGHDDDFITAPMLNKYQPCVAFQVRQEIEMIFRSAAAPVTPLAPWDPDSISDHWLDRQAWRVFACPGIADLERDFQVLCATSTAE